MGDSRTKVCISILCTWGRVRWMVDAGVDAAGGFQYVLVIIADVS